LIAKCYAKDAAPDIDINILFSETSGDMHMEITARGKQYNPFETMADSTDAADINEADLGFFLVKRLARNLQYQYRDGANIITVAL
jgi:anti-sigma regulatory factor (Ser/Thr protein kinase)